MRVEPALARNAVAWPLAGIGVPPPAATDLDLTILDRPRQLSHRAMQDISEKSDISSELTAGPGEPLANPPSPKKDLSWVVAIGASGALHAALAAGFLIAPVASLDFQDAMNAEGSDQSGASVVGSASDGQMPGAIDVSLVQELKPPKPQAAKPPAPTPSPLPPQERAAADTVAEPAQQPDARPDILISRLPRDDLRSSTRKGEPAASAAGSESAMPALTLTGQPPVPTAKPSAVHGSGAASSTDSARGKADGKEVKAPVASKGKLRTATGDAAKSRYSGKVASKLARANRLVSKSAQTKARNNATVTFVVQANGTITDLRLANSSGSPELDQFALNLVRRQAPFPPIPPEIGISSWRFRAPIGPF
jgi:protein TonB